MIKNLVFDVGNVLLGYRTSELLKEHGFDDETRHRFIASVFLDPIWAQIDLGIMPFEEIVEQFCRNAPDLREDIYWLMDSYDLMKVDRPDVWERVHLLKEKGYGIYILSNYGEYFYEKQFQNAPFMEWVDGAVISYQVHVIKPDPAIYRILLDQYALDPASCLFFDDLPDNIQTADDLGFQTFQVTSRETLLEELDRLLERQV